MESKLMTFNMNLDTDSEYKNFFEYADALLGTKYTTKVTNSINLANRVQLYSTLLNKVQQVTGWQTTSFALNTDLKTFSNTSDYVDAILFTSEKADIEIIEETKEKLKEDYANLSDKDQFNHRFRFM
ncbi:hypothetical protein ACN2AU_09155 [Aerococcus viridans]